MKMENPLEPVGRAALAASREMLALEPQEKAQALRLMAIILLLSPSAAPFVIRCRQKVRMLSRCRESISPTLRIGVRSAFLTQVSQRFMNRFAQPTLR